MYRSHGSIYRRGPRTAAWLCALSLAMAAACPAQAAQPRDWMVAVQPDGHLLFLDVLFPGLQATYQYNRALYGQANKLRLRSNALLTIPFYEQQVDAEIRLVVLTLGVGAGIRNVFRTLTFDEGQDYALRNRRGADSRSDYTQHLWGFGELRAELSLPFNDHVVFHSRNALRWEGRPDGSYDYRAGVVHDGQYFLSDNWLYLKHYEAGAIAPTFELLNFRTGATRRTLFNLGATVVTRAGLMVRDDLLYLQVLVNVAGARNELDRPTYGAHALYGPYTLLLAYRAQLDLDRLEMF